MDPSSSNRPPVVIVSEAPCSGEQGFFMACFTVIFGALAIGFFLLAKQPDNNICEFISLGIMFASIAAVPTLHCCCNRKWCFELKIDRPASDAMPQLSSLKKAALVIINNTKFFLTLIVVSILLILAAFTAHAVKSKMPVQTVGSCEDVHFGAMSGGIAFNAGCLIVVWIAAWFILRKRERQSQEKRDNDENETLAIDNEVEC